MKKIQCKKCNGDGFRLVPCGMDAYGEQLTVMMACPDCDGTGSIEVVSDDDKEDMDTVRREYGL